MTDKNYYKVIHNNDFKMKKNMKGQLALTYTITH